MIDRRARAGMQGEGPAPPTLQFLSIQVMPTGDGTLAVSFTGTYLDEEALEFINDDIEHERFTTVDDAVSAIERAIVQAFAASRQGGH